MTTLLAIACCAGCLAAIGRRAAGRVAIPEPVFLGSDGFGC
jgi:hypothetical protein